MPGLVPGIHAVAHSGRLKNFISKSAQVLKKGGVVSTWMAGMIPGSSPGTAMT
jgi:hypothetical protein